jgi:hypothetical protein
MLNAILIESKGGFELSLEIAIKVLISGATVAVVELFRMAIVRIRSIPRAIQFLRCQQGGRHGAFD